MVGAVAGEVDGELAPEVVVAGWLTLVAVAGVMLVAGAAVVNGALAGG